jgi:hypothetical protein
MLCQLCGSEPAATFHHLIPRTVHRNKWFRKRYDREELHQGLELCSACHRMIHRLIPDEKELGRRWNTREALLGHPMIARYLQWKRPRRLRRGA